MRVFIKAGESVDVCLEDTDGWFRVRFGKRALTVETDMPDSTGRVGVIYKEEFGKTSKDGEPAGLAEIARRSRRLNKRIWDPIDFNWVTPEQLAQLVEKRRAEKNKRGAR